MNIDLAFYMTPKEMASQKGWKSVSRVHALLKVNRIDRAFKIGRDWHIPRDYVILPGKKRGRKPIINTAVKRQPL